MDVARGGVLDSTRHGSPVSHQAGPSRTRAGSSAQLSVVAQLDARIKTNARLHHLFNTTAPTVDPLVRADPFWPHKPHMNQCQVLFFTN